MVKLVFDAVKTRDPNTTVVLTEQTLWQDAPAAHGTSDLTVKNDLNFDSLDVVELVMNVEECAGISITDEETQGMRTLGNLVDCVMSKEPQPA